jgi:SRSO17 transposase
MARKSTAPMALALDGGDVQARQQFSGPGQWQAEARLPQPWRLVDETVGEADGVVLVDSAECPKPGEPSVGGARQWCGRLGKVDYGQGGGMPRWSPISSVANVDFGAKSENRVSIIQ